MKVTLATISEQKIIIDISTIRIVHDTIWEGQVNIFTVHGGFTVLKDEGFEQLFMENIAKTFIKTWTRFGSNEELNRLGIKTTWEAGDRYVFYYEESLPIIEYDDKNGVFLHGQHFSIEKV